MGTPNKNDLVTQVAEEAGLDMGQAKLAIEKTLEVIVRQLIALHLDQLALLLKRRQHAVEVGRVRTEALGKVGDREPRVASEASGREPGRYSPAPPPADCSASRTSAR